MSGGTGGDRTLYQALYRQDPAKAEELLKRAEQLGGDASDIESAQVRVRSARTHQSGALDASMITRLN